MRRSIAAVAALAFVAGCSNERPRDITPTLSSTPSAAFVPIVDGWTAADRSTFYHLSEGSALFPLAWLYAIEVQNTDASGQKTLRPMIERFAKWGLLPDDSGPANPYGLPVGFTTMKLGKIRWAGINCAACHVGEVTYMGAHLRIDGGPNMALPVFDIMADLQGALTETFQGGARAQRFIDHVWTWSKAHPDPDEGLNRPTLEDLRLLRSGLSTAQRFPDLAASVGTTAGYSRIDAFGFARNVLFTDKANQRRIDAPVSTPDIWDMEHTAWLHWGANTNSVIERNLGQALATGVTYDSKTFDSTIDLAAAHTLETLGYKLKKPRWPENVFGPIDRPRAERGRALFNSTCASCHETPLRVTPTGLKVYKLFSPSEVGTDPAVAVNFDRPVTVNGVAQPFPHAALDVLEKIKVAYYQRNKVPAETQATWEARAVRAGNEWTPRLRATLKESADYDDTRVGKVYPAKPLAGAWATAPYLHNGSVPTIYDLLLPRAQRPAKFRVGQREFDPVHLGYQAPSEPASTFELDVSQPGNSNAGHEYGTAWTGEQRLDVIEYLKALQPVS